MCIRIIFFYYSSIEDRICDLHEAFIDKKVKAVF
jgi:muramoyltetrapeptide carboxypeptidase LdcA involved in peptidoglycan recycling